jgi:hypothetical protein
MWVGVKLVVVLLRIIANSYKEKHNLIGISNEVSVFFSTAISTVAEKRQQRSSDDSIAIDCRHSAQCDCSCPSTTIKYIGVVNR